MAIKHSSGCTCCGCAWSGLADLAAAELTADVATVLNPTVEAMTHFDFSSDLFGWKASTTDGFECIMEFISTDELTVYETITFKHLDKWVKYGDTDPFSCSGTVDYRGGWGFVQGTKRHALTTYAKQVEPDTVYATITGVTAPTPALATLGNIECKVRSYPTGTVDLEDMPCSSSIQNGAQCPSLASPLGAEIAAEYDTWSVPKSTGQPPNVNFHRLWYTGFDLEGEGIRNGVNCNVCVPSGTRGLTLTSGSLPSTFTYNCWALNQQTFSAPTPNPFPSPFHGMSGAINHNTSCPQTDVATTTFVVYDDQANGGNGISSGGNQNIRIVQQYCQTLSGNTIALQVLRDAADEAITVHIDAAGTTVNLAMAVGQLIGTFNITAATATAGSPVFVEPVGVATRTTYELFKGMRIGGHVIEFEIPFDSDLGCNLDAATFVQPKWYPLERDGWEEVDFKIRLTPNMAITCPQYRTKDIKRKANGCFSELHPECQEEGVCKAKAEYHIQPMTLGSVTSGSFPLPPFVRAEANKCETTSYYAMDRSQDIMDLGIPFGYRAIAYWTNVRQDNYTTEPHLWFISPNSVTNEPFYSNEICVPDTGGYASTLVKVQPDYATGYAFHPPNWPLPITLVTSIGGCGYSAGFPSFPLQDTGWEDVEAPWTSTLTEASYRATAWSDFTAQAAGHSFTMSWYSIKSGFKTGCEQYTTSTDTLEDMIGGKPHDNGGVEHVRLITEVVKPIIDQGFTWNNDYEASKAGDFVESGKPLEGLMFQHVELTTSFDYLGQTKLMTIDTTDVDSYFPASADIADWIYNDSPTVWIEVSGATDPLDDGYYTLASSDGVTLSLTGKTATEPTLIPSKVGVTAELWVGHISHTYAYAGSSAQDIANAGEIDGEPYATANGIAYDVVFDQNSYFDLTGGGVTRWVDPFDEEGCRGYGFESTADEGTGVYVFDTTYVNSTTKGLYRCGSGIADSGTNGFLLVNNTGYCFDEATNTFQGESGLCVSMPITDLPPQFGNSVSDIPTNTKGAGWTPDIIEGWCDGYKVVKIQDENDLVFASKTINGVDNNASAGTFPQQCCDSTPPALNPTSVTSRWVDLGSNYEWSPYLELYNVCAAPYDFRLFPFSSALWVGGSGTTDFILGDIGVFESVFKYKTKWVDCWNGLPDFSGITFNGSTDQRLDNDGNSVNETITAITEVNLNQQVKPSSDGTRATVTIELVTTEIDPSTINFTVAGITW